MYAIRLDNTKQIFGDNNLILPFDYLCAKSLLDGKVYKTNNTYTIHHFSGSWLTPWQKFRVKTKKMMALFLGETITLKIAELIKDRKRL